MSSVLGGGEPDVFNPPICNILAVTKDELSVLRDAGYDNETNLAGRISEIYTGQLAYSLFCLIYSINENSIVCNIELL